MKQYLWECDVCRHRCLSVCVRAEDWGDGIHRGIGPDCPECNLEMVMIETWAERLRRREVSDGQVPR